MVSWKIPGGEGLFIAVAPNPGPADLRTLGEQLRQEFRHRQNMVVMVFDDARAALEVRRGSRYIGEARFQAALAHQRAMYIKNVARDEHSFIILGHPLEAMRSYVVGALLGLWGAIVIRLLTQRLFIWNLLAGVMLGFVGLATLGLVRITLPGLRRTVGPVKSPAGAFALGLPFGLTTCPSCVPLLLPLATGAAVSGTPWYGATLFAAFSLGLGVPILILAVSAPALGRFQRLGRLARWLQLAGGLLLLLASAYFFLEAYKIWSVT